MIFPLFFSTLLSVLAFTQARATIESERLLEHQKRNYEWPPSQSQFVPNTTGWKNLMETRLDQVSEMPDPKARFVAYVQTIHAAMVTPNFTEYGFAVMRCPDALLQDLQQGIQDGMSSVKPEGYTSIIQGDQPWVISREDLMERIEKELHGYVEEFFKTQLELQAIYGLRLFRNDTSFRMHIDKKGTHAVGFVMHVDRSADAQDWPFYIEDFQGQTHQVLMRPGDIILYESSKCLHGRPQKLNGSWFCNVIGHYHPVHDDWNSMNHQAEAEYAVPPHWSSNPSSSLKRHPNLVYGGGMEEPDCQNNWCRTEQPDVQWKYGMAGSEAGYWVDPNFHKHKFAYKMESDDEF
jgi:hypothetical protein